MQPCVFSSMYMLLALSAQARKGLHFWVNVLFLEAIDSSRQRSRSVQGAKIIGRLVALIANSQLAARLSNDSS